MKDLLGEGIRPDGLTYAIEFEVANGGGHSATVSCPEPALRNASELKTALVRRGGKRAARRTGEISLELLRVRAKKAMPKTRLIAATLQVADSSHALIGNRNVLWGSSTGEAQVYRWESLHPGNRVEGCAVLEGANTTYFLPDGWAMTIDQYGNGKVTRA